MVGYGSSSRRHLDVEVVGADGVVLTRTTAMFSPNPIRRGLARAARSIYAMTLPNVPPPAAWFGSLFMRPRSRIAANKVRYAEPPP
jgi:hypothetical protein